MPGSLSRGVAGHLGDLGNGLEDILLGDVVPDAVQDLEVDGVGVGVALVGTHAHVGPSARFGAPGAFDDLVLEARGILAVCGGSEGEGIREGISIPPGSNRTPNPIPRAA